MSEITRKQIRIIHTCIARLNLSDDSYRAILSAYNVRSSTELDTVSAAHLIGKLQSMINSANVNTNPVPAKPRQKYDDLGVRPGKASPAQLRLIEVLWKHVCRQDAPADRAEALRKFMLRIVNIDNILWLEPEHVRKLVAALTRMKKQALKRPSPQPPTGEPNGNF